MVPTDCLLVDVHIISSNQRTNLYLVVEGVRESARVLVSPKWGLDVKLPTKLSWYLPRIYTKLRWVRPNDKRFFSLGLAGLLTKEYPLSINILHLLHPFLQYPFFYWLKILLHKFHTPSSGLKKRSLHFFHTLKEYEKVPSNSTHWEHLQYNFE